jgi:hypothetical protein
MILYILYLQHRQSSKQNNKRKTLTNYCCYERLNNDYYYTLTCDLSHGSLFMLIALVMTTGKAAVVADFCSHHTDTLNSVCPSV